MSENNSQRRNGKKVVRLHVEIPWPLHMRLCSRCAAKWKTKKQLIVDALTEYLTPKPTPVMDEDDQ